MEEVLDVLPHNLQAYIQTLDQDELLQIEEIRLRVGYPPILVPLNHSLPFIVSEKDIELCLSQISNHSFYRLEDELKQGFITLKGGHRVGLAGSVIIDNSVYKGIRTISSINIRIAKETNLHQSAVIHMLKKRGWPSTLVIGPPRSGKTTFLRAMAQACASQYIHSLTIIDERSEIAAMSEGKSVYTLPHVDVLDRCPKAIGIMMAIRSLSPSIILVDEIGSTQDKEAIQEACFAGVTVWASAHGRDVQDVKKRKSIGELLSNQAFAYIVELDANKTSTLIKVKS
ncbi:AAA family ATPase [Paenalkalicoccus suaedae]|uniref:AAA family ATPase n=1 Tax=Paenalkalicoccus suaedae TaxID=2592382 RepID=A0A859FE04_9BACI|nr:AAA family ATPase [Paenalkalicoccus suaedae]QKS70952.1 AAA family ATPase [Paenalkalicoccus suaedae]